MAATTSIDQKETTSLIGSDKVEGTAVYGPDRGKIGSLERVMIDKLSGKVAYAVLSFGGFLGMGEDYYPVPWSTLTYDTDLGGYRVKLHQGSARTSTQILRKPGVELVARERPPHLHVLPNQPLLGMKPLKITGASIWARQTHPR